MQHFDDVASPSAPYVRRLFRFPSNNASCQKQEKTGKENGEEDEKIDVKLILTGEDDAVRDLLVVF